MSYDHMFASSRLIIFGAIFLLLPSISAAHQKEQYSRELTYSGQNTCQMASFDDIMHRQLNREERQWYATFQQGTLFFDGWQDICKTILAELPPQKEERTAALLGSMGKRIGIEWAKNNAVRKIDTDQLRSWGERLKKARNNGSESIYETVEIIADEVEAILKN